MNKCYIRFKTTIENVAWNPVRYMICVIYNFNTGPARSIDTQSFENVDVNKESYLKLLEDIISNKSIALLNFKNTDGLVRRLSQFVVNNRKDVQYFLSYDNGRHYKEIK